MEEKYMAELKKKPIGITETILRDAHQSLIATRMPTEQMVPILSTLDKVADDVHSKHLRFSKKHIEVNPQEHDDFYLIGVMTFLYRKFD
jgi:hypothetical protein